MVSAAKKTTINSAVQNEALFEFYALSGDTAPTETFNNIKILNGSSLKEIDTGKLYLYDQENDTWEEQP